TAAGDRRCASTRSAVTWCGGTLLARQHRVLELLGDPRLDDRLRRNLDRLAGCRIAAHSGLALLHHQFYHAGQDELARAFQLLFGELRELVEVFACLRPLYFEPLCEMREQPRFPHPSS